MIGLAALLNIVLIIVLIITPSSFELPVWLLALATASINVFVLFQLKGGTFADFFFKNKPENK